MNQLQHVMDFCNQYLMFKILTTEPAQQLQVSTYPVQPTKTTHKKVSKGSKFEKPTKKITNISSNYKEESTQKPKTTRKKFQRPTKTKGQNHRDDDWQGPLNNKKQDDDYVPIQSLLSQMNIKTDRNRYDNNFVSFGSNERYDNPNFSSPGYGIGLNYPKSNVQPLTIRNQLKGFNEPFNNSSFLNRSTIKAHSQYFYESPMHYLKQNVGLGFGIPPSRSKSPLSNSKSCANLSQSPQTKSPTLSPSPSDLSLHKKKKKSDKSFFVPSNSSQKQQNLETSRLTSTNHIMAKFQKEVSEQMNEQSKNESIYDKFRATETRCDTKNNRKQGSLKQIDDYSIIQFDSSIREPLSYLSQARGPQRPLLIQVKK